MPDRTLEQRVAELEAFVQQLRGALRLSAALLGVLGGLIVAVVIQALSG